MNIKAAHIINWDVTTAQFNPKYDPWLHIRTLVGWMLSKLQTGYSTLNGFLVFSRKCTYIARREH